MVREFPQPFVAAVVDRSPTPTSVSLFGRSATEGGRLTPALLASSFLVACVYAQLQETALSRRTLPGRLLAPSSDLSLGGKSDISISIRKEVLHDLHVNLGPRLSPFWSRWNAGQKPWLGAPRKQLFERSLIEHVAEMVGGHVCVG